MNTHPHRPLQESFTRSVCSPKHRKCIKVFSRTRNQLTEKPHAVANDEYKRVQFTVIIQVADMTKAFTYD
jgi:hypothetical protein